MDEYTQEEKHLLVMYSATALPVLLSEDLNRPIDKTLGKEWVSAKAFEIAKQMLREYKKL